MATEILIDLGETLSAALDRAIAAGEDLSVPMGDIAGELVKQTKFRFETTTDPLGVPWKPSRRAIEEQGLTLNDSGDLKSSIKENWGKDFAEAGPERSAGAGRYAAIHQFGGTIVPRFKQALSFGGRLVARVVIPARPYLGWTPDAESYAIDALGAHLARAFGQDGAA